MRTLLVTASLIGVLACSEMPTPTNGIDSGAMTVDAGHTTSDAGTAADAGSVVDAGSPVDAGGCATLSFPRPPTASVLQEQYNIGGNTPFHYAVYGVANGTMRDALTFQVWGIFNLANPKLPLQTRIGPDTASDCTLCIRYQIGCSSPSNCQRTFIVQGGDFVLARADRNVTNGAFVAKAGDLKLVEWNLTTDVAVPGGACLTLPDYSFEARWGNPGAVVPAVAPDAGVDPCAGSKSDAVAKVGCNAGFTAITGAANTQGGTCMPEGSNGPAGSCTDTDMTCLTKPNQTMGRCVQFCGFGTYVSTGNCQAGYRCMYQEKFDVPPGSFGVCSRDCDATHACPSGQTCDAEGSCIW